MKSRLFVLFLFVGSAFAQTQVPTQPLLPDSTKLEIISAPKAFFPPEIDPKSVNGDVSVKLQVSETGEVAGAEIVSGDPALQQQALATAKEWKFKPFIRNGAAIPVNTTIHILFQPMRVRISQGVLEALIVKKVQPTYPADARAAGIQGSVVTHVIIGTDASLKQATVVSGDPKLAPAALDAIRRWKFKQYFLNGKPVEIESQITIHFELGGYR